MSIVSPATFIPTHAIIRGQDWSFVATFTDDVGAPLNLTGWIIESDVRTFKNDFLAEFSISFPSGRTAGIAEFSLSRTQTLALEDESYFDVFLTNTENLRYPYLKGILPSEIGRTLP